MADIDIDEIGSSGLQFDPKSTGDKLNVKVVINSETGGLFTIQFKIFYDDSVLDVESCTKSGHWADKSMAISLKGVKKIMFFT